MESMEDPVDEWGEEHFRHRDEDDAAEEGISRRKEFGRPAMQFADQSHAVRIMEAFSNASIRLKSAIQW
jgi:hypothetical protein